MITLSQLKRAGLGHTGKITGYIETREAVPSGGSILVEYALADEYVGGAQPSLWEVRNFGPARQIVHGKIAYADFAEIVGNLPIG